MAPSIASSSTHYALVVDAGSSGSRLQIYSWRDPDLERAEILQEVARAQDGRGEPHRAWWWNSWIRNKWKGKGKEREQSMEKTALRRLVRVGKGVEGDAWVKRVEPGEHHLSSCRLACEPRLRSRHIHRVARRYSRLSCTTLISRFATDTSLTTCFDTYLCPRYGRHETLDGRGQKCHSQSHL